LASPLIPPMRGSRRSPGRKPLRVGMDPRRRTAVPPGVGSALSPDPLAEPRTRTSVRGQRRVIAVDYLARARSSVRPLEVFTAKFSQQVARVAHGIVVLAHADSGIRELARDVRQRSRVRARDVECNRVAHTKRAIRCVGELNRGSVL